MAQVVLFGCSPSYVICSAPIPTIASSVYSCRPESVFSEELSLSFVISIVTTIICIHTIHVILKAV
jgi:hypothetical protein